MMLSRVFLLFLLFFLPAQRFFPSVNLFLQPGIDIFNDAVGLDVFIGAKSDLFSLFHINFDENFNVGARLGFSTAGVEELDASVMALCLDTGYDFYLDKTKFLSFSPSLSIGFTYTSITLTNGYDQPLYGAFFLPMIGVNMFLFNTMNLGISGGFKILTSGMRGAFIGTTIGFNFK